MNRDKFLRYLRDYIDSLTKDDGLIYVRQRLSPTVDRSMVLLPDGIWYQMIDAGTTNTVDEMDIRDAVDDFIRRRTFINGEIIRP